MAIWIILHEFKEGAVPRLVESRGKPSMAAAKKVVGKEFNPRAGSEIRIIGPYNRDTIPQIGKRRRHKEEPPEEDFEPFDPFEEEEE